jgi:hypothetical protein
MKPSEVLVAFSRQGLSYLAAPGDYYKSTYTTGDRDCQGLILVPILCLELMKDLTFSGVSGYVLIFAGFWT